MDRDVSEGALTLPAPNKSLDASGGSVFRIMTGRRCLIEFARPRQLLRSAARRLRVSDVVLIKRFQFLLWLVALFYSPVPNRAQDLREDTVRVRTRVVFVDTLVQDKRTGAPVADLTR